MKSNRYEIDMTSGAMLPKLVTFAVPLFLSSMLQLLFNAVDVMVVGRFAGSNALAAVGSTTALIHLFTNLFIGISMGTNVLAAHTYAARDYDQMSEAVHTSILLALVSGTAMIFAGIFFSRPALMLMGTPGDVIDQSTLYMRIYFFGMPFFMLYNYGAATLRAVGDTRRPLLFLAVSGAVNACLNLLLVIVFHLDVAGVAIATVISQAISCVLVLRCLITADAPYRLDPARLHIHPGCLKQIFQVGIPSGVQSCVISFSNVCLQSSVNSFGATAMAGYTASNNMLGFLYAGINSVTQASMSFASQNLGAGKLRRIDRLLAECMGLEVCVGLGMGGLGYLLGENLMRIYTEDPLVIQAGLEVISITFLPYFLCGFMDLFAGLMRGLGYAFVPMILSVLGTVGLRLLWIFFYFPTHRTLWQLFLSYPVSWTGTFLMQAACYFLVRRRIWQRYGARAGEV